MVLTHLKINKKFVIDVSQRTLYYHKLEYVKKEDQDVYINMENVSHAHLLSKKDLILSVLLKDVQDIPLKAVFNVHHHMN